MGPPGSGKGTQARLLVERTGAYQLATGDLFRHHLGAGTSLGTLAKSYMDTGAYVPDDVTVRMVREKLGELPAGQRVVFDGFPRTVPQADALDGLLAERGRSLAAVIVIEVPRDELLGRLGARATCASCQAVYSLTVRPPRVAGVCDRCGGPVSGTARADESPDIVRKRLAVYGEQTKPVVDHYERRGLVKRVSGVGEIEDITRRLEAAVA
ncbi:MAG: adenylate kinase [Chloroflexi bacterium]|nr:adenylate kinase [Chloroflexota bacterium]